MAQPHPNVYEIQLADGTGPPRRVTRTEILDLKETIPNNHRAETAPQSSEIAEEPANPAASQHCNEPILSTEDTCSPSPAQGDDTNDKVLVFEFRPTDTMNVKPTSLADGSKAVNPQLQPQSTHTAEEPAVPAVSFEATMPPTFVDVSCTPPTEPQISVSPTLSEPHRPDVLNSPDGVMVHEASNSTQGLPRLLDTSLPEDSRSTIPKKPVRRCTRIAAGKHSNPHHLPRVSSSRAVMEVPITPCPGSTLLSSRLDGWLDGFLQQAVRPTTPLRTARLHMDRYDL